LGNGTTNPGQLLRSKREQLGLTIRDVEAASHKLAEQRSNDELILNISRLSDFETKSVIPSIFRLYALAVIYGLDYVEVASWYGLDLTDQRRIVGWNPTPKTNRVNLSAGLAEIRIPIRLDPGFDLARTSNIGRLIEKWGTVPLAFLDELSASEFTYGYVGTEDFTMYPLILPGSFLRIDESKSKVLQGMWRSEYERPIYFIETREGFVCSWCSLKGNQLTIQPHPLSPVPAKILKHPHEGEVIGQVVGVAMNLIWSADVQQSQKARPELP
jgi:transcriptional regulator with XRE-family HTH domain